MTAVKVSTTKAPRLPKGIGARKALLQLANAGVTGALTVFGEPGGVIFLLDGRVTAIESPAAPGVDLLLTACGKVDARIWETFPARPGRALVEGGHVTAAELELCVLNGLFDAAYYVLSTEPAEVRFNPDAQHWLGTDGTVPADRVCDSVDRQRRILHEAHPSDSFDRSAVVPVRRPGLDRVLLSGLQWEIVLHADGARTPHDLAVLLGRSAFAVALDVRRLAAAGLIEPPEAEVATAGTPQAGPAEAEVSKQEEPEKEVLPRRVPGTYTFEDPPVVNRRPLPAGVTALAVLPGAIDKPPDDSLLKRIRTALQALR